MAELKVYSLKSAGMFDAPGMMEYFKQGFKSEPHRFFWLVAMAYSTLPALLIMDLLSGRCPYAVDQHKNVVIEWSGPMGEWKDYYNDPEKVCDGD